MSKYFIFLLSTCMLLWNPMDASARIALPDDQPETEEPAEFDPTEFETGNFEFNSSRLNPAQSPTPNGNYRGTTSMAPSIDITEHTETSFSNAGNARGDNTQVEAVIGNFSSNDVSGTDSPSAKTLTATTSLDGKDYNNLGSGTDIIQTFGFD